MARTTPRGASLRKHVKAKWRGRCTSASGGKEPRDRHRRNPKRLAETQALAAIALQVRQSFWGRCRYDSLIPTMPTGGRQVMAWKNLVSPFAITSRRRVVASVLCGISRAVRFISAAGEESESPARSMQRTGFSVSLMNRNSVQFPFQDWSPRSAQPIVLRQGWPLSSGSCRAACDSSMPRASISGCVSS